MQILLLSPNTVRRERWNKGDIQEDEGLLEKVPSSSVGSALE